LAGQLARFQAEVAIDSAATALIRADRFRASTSLVSYLDATRTNSSLDQGTMSLVAPAAEAGAGWTGCDLIGKRVGIDSLTSLQTIALREMLRTSECADTASTGDSVDEEGAVGDDESTDVEAEGTDVEAADLAGADQETIPGVTLVQMDAVSMKAALQSGDLDAGVFVDPNITRLLRENEGFDVPVAIVTNLDAALCGNNRCPVSVAVGTNAWIDRDPDVARRFSLSIDQTIEWILENDLEYRAALVSCCALNANDASDIPKPNFVGNDGDLAEELDRIIDVLIAQGEIADRSVVSDLVVDFE